MSKTRRTLVQRYYEWDRSFYRYPMNISPHLVIGNGFEEYVFEGRGNDPSYFRKERRNWFSGIKRDKASRFHQFVTDNFMDKDDEQVMRNLFTEHGIFHYRFFHRRVYPRVYKKYYDKSYEFRELREMIGKLHRRAWQQVNRDYYIKTERNVIVEIYNHIYEQTIHSLMTKRYGAKGELRKWFSKHSVEKKCALCGRIFRVIDLPADYYFGSDGCLEVCFSCPILETPKKGLLEVLVPEFINSCGFIPDAKASPITYSFTIRLETNKKIEVFKKYGKMGGIEHVKKKFGSWFKAMAETGVLPDGVMVLARGIKCLAKDGHVCRSLAEQQIDDWLFSHSIFHDREPLYPFHPDYNKSNRRRADWFINGCFVEYFGLIGDDKYEKKMMEKIRLASLTGIELISIYPADLNNLNIKLAKLINNPDKLL